jgi:hypothetical protein
MKKIKMIKVLNILLFAAVVFSGCVDLKDDSENDKSELMRLLDEDTAIGLDGYDDEGVVDVEFDTGLESIGMSRVIEDTLSYGEGYRIRFGRQIISRDRSVEFNVDGDTAIGVISYNLNGIFRVSVKDTSSLEIIDSMSFSKNFESLMTRKVKFFKIPDNSSVDGYRWKISAITPIVGSSGNKVSISSLNIFSLDISTNDNGENLYNQGDLLFSMNSDNSGDLYLDRENLPTFNAFQQVMIKINVENNGPEYALDSLGVGEWVMHRFGRNSYQRGRRKLNDRGVASDSIVNDNTHTAIWRLHGPGFGSEVRVFRSFFNTVDLATIFVEVGEYNNVTWSIPYKIVRQN